MEKINKIKAVKIFLNFSIQWHLPILTCGGNTRIFTFPGFAELCFEKSISILSVLMSTCYAGSSWFSPTYCQQGMVGQERIWK